MTRKFCHYSASHKGDPTHGAFDAAHDHIGNTCPKCSQKIARSLIDGYNQLIESGLTPEQARDVMI